MSILNYGPHNVDPYAEMKFDTEDIAIGGKMVVGSIVVSAETLLRIQSEAAYTDYIKRHLATQLTNYLLDNKLVEFTMSEDAINQTKVVRVRGYLAPDSEVKLLRVHKKSSI